MTRSSSAEIRERLLSEARRLFLTQGYHATGVQQITDAAGVPKGSFYNHFSSKDDMAIAALAQYAVESPLDLLVNRDVSPIEAIRSHFEELARRFRDTELQRGCMMGNLANEIADQSHAVRHTLANLFDGWTQLVAAAITDAQSQGLISPAMPIDHLAAAIISLWEGSLIRARVEASEEPIEDFFATVFTHLLRPA